MAPARTPPLQVRTRAYITEPIHMPVTAASASALASVSAPIGMAAAPPTPPPFRAPCAPPLAPLVRALAHIAVALVPEVNTTSKPVAPTSPCNNCDEEHEKRLGHSKKGRAVSISILMVRRCIEKQHGIPRESPATPGALGIWE